MSQDTGRVPTLLVIVGTSFGRRTDPTAWKPGRTDSREQQPKARAAVEQWPRHHAALPRAHHLANYGALLIDRTLDQCLLTAIPPWSDQSERTVRMTIFLLLFGTVESGWRTS